MTETMGVPATPAVTWSSASWTEAGSAAWSNRGRSCLVVINGELTWRVSRRLHASFRSAVAQGGRAFSVDLRSVSEVDPAGIAVLVVYARLLPSLDGTLEVSAASPPCRALLQRMRLSHLLVPAQAHVAAAAAGA